MKSRAFNWKLAGVFTITVVMLSVGAVLLRQWQVNRLYHRTSLDLDGGLRAYEDYQWEAAAGLLSKYLAFNKGDADTWLKFAEAQLNIRPLLADNINQAAAAYRTVLRLEKTNSEAAMKLTALFLDMKVPAEAQLIAENFLKEKDDADIRRVLAISLAEQRDFGGAQSHLKNVIDNHPDAVSAYDTMARIIERHPESFPGSAPEYWYDILIGNNPSSAEAVIARADFYLRSKSTEKAFCDLKAAEELDMSEPVVRLKLARCYLDAHFPDKAREHLIRVREERPDTLLLWHLWAAVALEGGSKEEMAEVADAGLKEVRRQPWDFMPAAAELFIRAGRFGEAANCLTELRKKGVAPLPTLYLEGLLAEAQGQDHAAIQFWRKARQSGYSSQEMVFCLTRAYRRTGDRQSAIRELRTYISENPDNVYAQLRCADLYGEIADWKNALAHLDVAGRISPNDAEIAFHSIRAKVRLAAAEENTSSAVWAEYEKQLSTLEGMVENKVPVRLLRAEAALRKKDFGNARAIIEELKAAGDEPFLDVEMAEVELLICEGRNEEAIEKLYAVTRHFPQELLPLRYLLAVPGGAGKEYDYQCVVESAIETAHDNATRRELVLLLSGFYQKRGRSGDALELLKQASADMPEDIPLKRRLLGFVGSGADREYGQQLVDQIRTIEGEGGWQWRWEQARLWMGSSDSERYSTRAIGLLKENLSVNPSDRNSLLLLASAYESGGQPQLAAAIQALSKTGQHEEADRLLNAALKQKASHPMIALLELQRNLRRGHLDSAESVLEHLLDASEEGDFLYLPLALVRMRQDKFEEARQLLSELKVQEPHSVPVTAALVELNLRMKMNAEAMELCDEIVSEAASSEAYVLRAKTRTVLGDAQKARADFDRAVGIEPDNAYAWMSRSGFHAAMGEAAAAVADIERAMELAPGDIQIRKQAIILLAASDKADQRETGKRLLDEFLAAEPEDVDMRLCKVRYLVREGGASIYEEAERILEGVVEAEPGNIEAWSVWVQLCLDEGRLGEAVDVALRGLSYSSDDKSLLLLKAKAEAARSPVLAIGTLMVLNEREPADFDTAVQLASAYTAGGQHTAAVEVLERLVASCSEGDRKRASIALAAGLHNNNMTARGRQEFDKLYTEYPDDGQVLIAEADALAENPEMEFLDERIRFWSERHIEDRDTLLVVAGKLAASEKESARDTAERLLDAILQRAPTCLPAMQMLAMLLQSEGRTTESAEIYGRILKVEKDNVVVMNNLAWMLCEAEHRYKEALELARDGLERTPDYTDLIDTCGVIYYRLGEHQQAVQELSRCVKMYPENSQALVASRFHLARALAALGEDKGAIENLEISLDMHDKVGGLSQSEVAEADSLRRALLEVQTNVTVTK